MKINRLQAVGYRNLAPLQWEPSPGVNIIYGENAQGKTNLLESVWLFSGLKSFRGSKDSETVGFGQPFAKLQMDFTAFDREQKACITIEKNRKATLNGVPLPSPVRLMGHFSASVFSPSFLSLVQAGPAERRKFIDTALCQLKPGYASLLTEYNRTLKQRNSLLADAAYHSELSDMLDVWDERLAVSARNVTQQRENYLSLLLPAACRVYDGLSGGKEKLHLTYIKKMPESENGDFLSALKKNRKQDFFAKTTCIGPHRDDIGIFINDIAARSYGSQGQQRSCAIAMKLAEAEILHETNGEQPVILLDDVMSELDTGRQDYILNHLDGRQVLITCCDPASILRMCGGTTVYIENGKITETGE